MYNLSDCCYVCLTEKKHLQCITNSDTSTQLLEKLDYCSFNMERTKLLESILICEECCRNVHIAYEFITMCRKNSGLLLGYLAQLEHTTVLNENTPGEVDDLLFDVKNVKVENSTNIKDNTPETQNILNIVENTSTNEYISKIHDPLTKHMDYSQLKIKTDDENISEDETLAEDSLKLYREVKGELLISPTDYRGSNSFSTKDDCTEFTCVSPESSAVIKHKTDLRFDNHEIESVYLTESNNYQLLNVTENENSLENSTDITKKQCAIQKNKNVNTNKLFLCTFCDRQFTAKCGLNVHKKIHTGEKPYKCSVCNKCFTQRGNLNVHKLVHTGEKSYKCSICSKCFAHKVSLINHKLLHTGEKPHTCLICNKSFTHKASLISHNFIHTGDNPYKCEVCNKCFTNSGNLNTHISTHTGAKPYKCTICNKCFAHKGNLISHNKIHTGEKPYKCSMCTKCFTQKTSLINHTLTHTGEKPYKCTVCNKCFTQSSTLKVHKLIHTGEKSYK